MQGTCKTIITLEPETAVPVKSLRDNLSYFQDLQSPNGWTGHLRGSPTKEKPEDAKVVISAIEEASKNPVKRPVDKKKLYKQPKTYKTKNGEVTVPDNSSGQTTFAENVHEKPSDEITHEEIQWLLLKLGQDLGMELWVAKNDKNKSFKGNCLGEFAKMKTELPTQFDYATNKTIELIDVLWLKGNTIVAAFEVEHTTSIYSGLLRMSDLVSLQPNLNISLYIVAPDKRRDKVLEEINRPTFSRLKPPLNEFCQYIPYSVLNERFKQATESGLIRYLKPEFIDEIAETCVPEIT